MAKSSTEIIIGKDTKYQVTLRVEATGGRGFSAFIYGGDKAHVGAVSLVSPKLEEQKVSFGNEFDEEVASYIATRLADAFREPASCTAGIELKGADEKDLQQLKINYKATVTHYIASYDRTK